MARTDNVENSLYEIQNLVTMSDALAVLKHGVTRPTLIKWCRDYHIGIQVGTRWYVDLDKLALLLKGAAKRDGF